MTSTPSTPTGEPAVGSTLGGGVAVHEHGAGSLLAGPGTGRAVSVPEQSRAERFTSYDPDAFEVPSGREEDWRFTPIDRLHGLHAHAAGVPLAAAGIAVTADLAPGVTLEQLERGDSRLGRALRPGDRVAARAWAGFDRAEAVVVPAGLIAERPTFVSVRGADAATPAFGHVLVEVGAEAQAVVVLDHTGAATLAANVEVVLGDNAALTLVTIHDWEPGSVHVTQHAAVLGRDARLTGFTASLGGDVVRVSTDVRFDGPGGDAELWGMYFADTGQHLEHRLFIDHHAPHCRSRVTYKGALQGQDSHSVWVGDVLIRHQAEGTDTYELNRNLVLTDGARADSVPNLEIETGEIVGAGHASATGRFDDEQLFYLMSRGIALEEARRLVVRGFFADIIAKVKVPTVEDRLSAAIESELTGVGA